MRSQTGNAIVEFAVALPFLILVMLGITEIGRYAYTAMLVSNAARAGAQYGSQGPVHASLSANMTAAAEANGGNIPINSVTYSPGTASYYCWNSSSGTETSTAGPTGCTAAGTTLVEYISYTVSGTLRPLFHYPKLPASFNVSSTATMRVCLLCGNGS